MPLVPKLLTRLPGLRGLRYHGFQSLDRKAEPYLDFDGGFFVEAGANDGRRYSNTLYFERYRGWRGLLVEPIPDLAAGCRRNRPDAIVEEVALVPADYAGSTVEMRYCDMMSLVVGAMKSREEEDEHIRKGCAFQKIGSHQLSVPARTLSELLDRQRIECVDLLSLDVEGFELPALRGLDLNCHAPRFILVEARYRDEIEDYLGPRYQAIAALSHHDVLYRRAESAPTRQPQRPNLAANPTRGEV